MSNFTEEHYEAYREVMNKLDAAQQKNKEYQALAYVITSKPEFVKKAAPYMGTYGFKSIDCLENNDFSSGDHKLLKLGMNLYNNHEMSSPVDLITSLDDESFQVAMNAIYIRKYGVR